MFLIILAVIFALGNVSSDDSERDPGLNLEACDIGDVIENECIKCICSARYLFDCTSKSCPKTYNASDENSADVKGQSCRPHKIYNLDETICICNPDGRWPHKSCHNIFGPLPTSHITKQKCIPGSYVVIDCNICRCNDKGQIDNERCTKNECDPIKVSNHRRNTKSGQVYGKCKAKSWYSYGPCQFCHCLNNNKLMCNTGTKNSNSVRLGTYNFSVCGTDLLKEALQLSSQGKEAENVLRLNKDTETSVSINDETTTKAAEKSDFKVIDLEMDQHNNNDNDDDGDDDGKTEEHYVKITATRSKTGKKDSQDFSESDNESEAGGEKFTKQPYEENDNIEIDSDNGEGRTEDRDDKNDENNSEDMSEESMPVKQIEREQPLNIPVKSAEDDSEPSMSIKFDSNKAEQTQTQERLTADEKKTTKKRKKQSKYDDKKDDEDEETMGFDLGQAIKNNLPMMVGHVLSNLRKTVNLESENDCEPGTQYQVQCNVCHCLKNKKMICTDNKCE